MTIRRRLALGAVLLCASTVLSAEPPPTPLLTHTPDQLVAILRLDAASKDKADACRELAVVGTASAVPVLVPLLADDNLNHMALYALQSMPGADVDKALRAQLAKLDGRRLVGVIGTLGVRQDSRAVKPLVRLLANPNPNVARAAVRALGSIGNDKAARALLAALPSCPSGNRPAISESCLRCADRLDADGQSAQAIAVYEQLLPETNLPQPVRLAALRALILARGPDDLALLKESLESADYTVFSTALQAAMQMPAPEVTRTVAQALPLLPTDNRVAIVQALGARGDAEVLPALHALATDGRLVTRLAALKAIAAVGGPAAISAMMENLDSTESEISRAARDGLAGIPGPEADAAVAAMLADTDVDRRIVGIKLAGRRRLTAQAPALLDACSASDTRVRVAAFRCIGELGRPDDVPFLINLVLRSAGKPDNDAAADALKTLLARTGEPDSATTQIISAMTQSQPAQKCALLSVLCSAGGSEALSAVRHSLDDPDAHVRDAAIRALSDWSDPSATADLLTILRSTNALPERELVFRSYVRLAIDSLNPASDKFQMLRQAAALAAGPQDQKLVLSGLGNIVSIDSLRFVATRLSNPLLADEAAAAAIQIAGKLGAKYQSDVGLVLDQVLKTAKSQRLLDLAHARIRQLAGSPKLN